MFHEFQNRYKLFGVRKSPLYSITHSQWVASWAEKDNLLAIHWFWKQRQMKCVWHIWCSIADYYHISQYLRFRTPDSHIKKTRENCQWKQIRLINTVHTIHKNAERWFYYVAKKKQQIRLNTETNDRSASDISQSLFLSLKQQRTTARHVNLILNANDLNAIHFDVRVVWLICTRNSQKRSLVSKEEY